MATPPHTRDAALPPYAGRYRRWRTFQPCAACFSARGEHPLFPPPVRLTSPHSCRRYDVPPCASRGRVALPVHSHQLFWHDRDARSIVAQYRSPCACYMRSSACCLPPSSTVRRASPCSLCAPPVGARPWQRTPRFSPSAWLGRTAHSEAGVGVAAGTVPVRGSSQGHPSEVREHPCRLPSHLVEATLAGAGAWL